MPAQTYIPPAANALGTIGTVLWCVQLIPQIYHNWKRKDTEGLPGSMLALWSISAVPFGTYAIAQNLNMPIQIQPQIFCVLSLITWAQTLHYAHHWRTWTASLLAVSVGCACGGAEAALILTLRPLYERGVEFPVTIIGSIAAVLLALGLLPPYYEIWKHKGQVVGINWIFLSVDWSGAFFSLMSLVAQRSFDELGGTLYIICMALESGIFGCHFVWLLRSRKQRKKAAVTKDEEASIAEVVTDSQIGAGEKGAGSDDL